MAKMHTKGFFFFNLILFKALFLNCVCNSSKDHFPLALLKFFFLKAYFSFDMA